MGKYFTIRRLFYPYDSMYETVPSSVIETNKFIIRIYEEDSYLEFIIKEGITLDAKDAMECKRLIAEACPTTKFYVLAEGIRFFTLTLAARRLCSTKEFSSNTLAIAFCTANVSLQIMGEMYNKINKPVVPTKIFNNRHNAKVWLEEQMDLKRPIQPTL